MWYLYALLSGLFTAIGGLLTRKIMGKLKDGFVVSFYFSFICTILMLPFFIYEHRLPSSVWIWILIFLISAVIVLLNYLSISSYKYLGTSTVNILAKMKYLWILLISIFFIKEDFSVLQIIGIVLISVASIIIVDFSNWKATKKGVFMILGSTILMAAFGIGLKILVADVGIITSGFFLFFIPAILNAVVMPDFFKRIKIEKVHFKLLIPFAVNGIFSNLTLAKALDSTQFSLVFFVIESSLIFIILGEYFILKEKERLFFKIAAIIIAIIGTVLIK